MRFIILVGVLLSFLSAEPREALLIGTSNYEYISELNNPLANLKRLKKSLEEVGFNVKIKTELNAERLEEAIDVFSKRLAKDKETIGFVYYTGHGCQVKHQGYLLPINADSRKQSKIKYRALNINEMIGTLKESGNRVNMFFLDACRDIPVGTKGRSKGLGQIKNTPKGTLVVYATKDGEVAEDNSDFINSIISSIQEPKQSIRNLPYSISDVFKQGSTSQTPIFSAVEIPKVVLKSGYVSPVKPVQPQSVYVPETRRVETPTTNPNIVKIGNLIYQNQPFTKKYTWDEAKKYCSELSLEGYNRWRLPLLKELLEIGNIDIPSDQDYETSGYLVHEWFSKNKSKRLKNKRGDSYFIKKDFIENISSNSEFFTSEVWGWRREFSPSVDFENARIIDGFSGKSACICVTDNLNK